MCHRNVSGWHNKPLYSTAAAQDKREQGTYKEMREYLGELY